MQTAVLSSRSNGDCILIYSSNSSGLNSYTLSRWIIPDPELISSCMAYSLSLVQVYWVRANGEKMPFFSSWQSFLRCIFGLSGLFTGVSAKSCNLLLTSLEVVFTGSVARSESGKDTSGANCPAYAGLVIRSSGRTSSSSIIGPNSVSTASFNSGFDSS